MWDLLQVAVLGASGGIGQPLSMLLKMNPMVTELALYDIANTPGVAADLSHCNTPAKVRSFSDLSDSARKWFRTSVSSDDLNTSAKGLVDVDYLSVTPTLLTGIGVNNACYEMLRRFLATCLTTWRRA